MFGRNLLAAMAATAMTAAPLGASALAAPAAAPPIQLETVVGDSAFYSREQAFVIPFLGIAIALFVLWRVIEDDDDQPASP